MSHIRAFDTKPEVMLRHALWRLVFRYTINDHRLPGSPDIVFPKYRTVIFVHGCFWHCHKDCKYYTVPKTNTFLGEAKVARNQERDQEARRKLVARGWGVIIVWECQLKKGPRMMSSKGLLQRLFKTGKPIVVLKKKKGLCEKSIYGIEKHEKKRSRPFGGGASPIISGNNNQ